MAIAPEAAGGRKNAFRRRRESLLFRRNAGSKTGIPSQAAH
jgi:hypothetical protein